MDNFFKGLSVTTGVILAIIIFVLLVAMLCCCVVFWPLLLDPTVQNVMDVALTPAP